MRKNLKLAFLLLSIILINSCISNNKVLIEGNITNSVGKKIIIKELTTSKALTIDSAIIDENGDFSIKFKAKRIAYYAFFIDKKYLTLILQPKDKINIKANIEDFDINSEIEGSDECKLVNTLNYKLLSTITDLNSIRREYADSSLSPNFEIYKTRLTNRYDSIEKAHKEFSLSFIRSNYQYLASLMALYQQLSTDQMLLNPKDDFDYFALVDSSMMRIYPEAESVKELHSTIGDIKEQHLQQKQLEERTSIGAKLPEIVLPSTDGKYIKLSSLYGKYVLVDFWASWCSPCIKENPVLVRNYWRYKNKGFDIYQISLDSNPEAWKGAIKAQGLWWNHVSDLKEWKSPIVKLFNINSIPYNILIDKEGKIIAKNLRGEELNEKLKEIFNY